MHSFQRNHWTCIPSAWFSEVWRTTSSIFFYFVLRALPDDFISKVALIWGSRCPIGQRALIFAMRNEFLKIEQSTDCREKKWWQKILIDRNSKEVEIFEYEESISLMQSRESLLLISTYIYAVRIFLMRHSQIWFNRFRWMFCIGPGCLILYVVCS